MLVVSEAGNETSSEENYNRKILIFYERACGGRFKLFSRGNTESTSVITKEVLSESVLKDLV
jgi:hypothetical protein